MMSAAIKPYNEAERLKTLKELQILDTLPESCYDDIVKLAATICGTPVALISLVDEYRQWFKAHHGINSSETPREISFCAHTILSTEPLIITDTLLDVRFSNNPLVLYPPHGRFYAGIPLLTKSGHALGSLCVIDTQPRVLSSVQIESLKALARATTSQFELRFTLLKGIEQEFVIEQQRMKMIQTARLSALGEMAAGIAHEINNPLSIIRGKVQLMEMNLANNSVDLGKFSSNLVKIDETISRITKIISGLKSFARNGEKDPFLTVPAQTIIGETLELCQKRFEGAGVDLNIEMPATEIPLQCRSVQISQVLLNLLNNAFDAVQKLPEKWIKITLETKKDRAIFRISDSGKGIPKDLQDKIMQPFFTTKEPGKGTGLGLSLSTGIIQGHSGQLEIDSSSPHTCFVVSIPLAAPKEKLQSIAG